MTGTRQAVAVVTETGAAATAAVDRLPAWIAVLPRGADLSQLLPHGPVLAQRAARRAAPEPEPEPEAIFLCTDLPNGLATRAAVAEVEPALATFERLGLGRRLAAAVLETRPTEVGVTVAGLPPEVAQGFQEAIVAALLAAVHPMPDRRTKPDPAPRLKRIVVHGVAEGAISVGARLARTVAEDEGNGLARSLSRMPPNELSPGEYIERVRQLAGREGFACEFLDEAALAGLGAGAFLAVCRGSEQRDAGVLKLTYRPPGRAKGRTKAHTKPHPQDGHKASPTVALVGKGICFDTGGVNLKTARYMHGMHEDMQGSAVALGALLALARLQAPFALECWLAIARNDIGPNGYRPNEVVEAANGETIEVIHTDAEGRMLLADCLALVARGKPDLIIDYATLTGACIQALGTNMSGAFTNRPALIPALWEAGWRSGERIWPFPMERDYDEALKSEIADTKQCTLDDAADHILAARFLSRFVGAERPWVHLDLAASSHKGGLAHIPTDTTGFGVRYTCELLLGGGLLDRLGG